MTYITNEKGEAREVNDPHLLIRFFSKPKKNEAKSQEAGRPIYEDIDYVSIKWANDKTRELEAPAHSSHRMRRNSDPDEQGGWETYAESYPTLYAAFKAGNREQVNGTLLSEMTSLSAARREELKALNIVTVEALAGLDGSALKRLGMDGRKLKEQAQNYLDRAKGAAVDERHAAELGELRRQIEELRAAQTGAPSTVAPKAAKAGKGKKDESAEDAAARAAFEQYGEEDLRNYVHDATGTEPLASLKFAQLVDEAVKANAANRRKAA